VFYLCILKEPAINYSYNHKHVYSEDIAILEQGTVRRK
jgi:hypothetical protein